MTYMRMAHEERRAVQNWTDMACDGRRAATERFLLSTLEALEAGKEGCLVNDRLSDIAAHAWNAVSDLNGELAKHLDEVGLEYKPIDVTPLEKFL